MNLHSYLYVIIFLIYFTIVDADDIMVLKKGLEDVSLYTSGLIFLIDVNNTSDEDFNVELLPDRCCLRNGVNEDCGVLEVIGGCVEKIPKGTGMTLTAVAPLLDPFDRVGNCIFHLDSKPHNRNRRTTRNRVKITFNTQLKNKKQLKTLPYQIKPCNRIDEDPFNDCDPVDCETYYNGKRSYFNQKLRRCTKVPVCLSNKDVTEATLYDPIANRCLVEDYITNDDINFIRDMIKESSKPSNDVIFIKSTYTPPKQDLIINSLKHGDEVNDINPPYLNFTEVYKKIKNPEPKMCFKAIVNTITKSKCTLTVLAVIVLVQCCLICSMIYFLAKHCKCCQKKKVIRKFFNKRRDMSVTTPLICTSNIDTETAFNYSSESSNVDKKIKCYKACQKERKNMKMSLSDDILSKCLNRRDWKCNPARYNVTQQKLSPHTEYTTKNIETSPEESNTSKLNQLDDKNKSSEVKVNFENEHVTVSDKKDKKNNKFVGIIKKLEHKNKKAKKETKDPQCDLSEMEIKCHSYNEDIHSNYDDYNQSAHSNNCNLYQINKTKCISISTEKGAQASFSNDSIDDLLSERGLFLHGENASKYSFSVSSDQKKTSSVSSKTSTNIVRKVLSLLQRRSKHGACSETDVKKNKGNTGVELIHMSRASVYSSSNYEYDYMKGFNKPKGSGTSL